MTSIFTNSGAFVDGFRVLTTVGLEVENPQPGEESAWWEYVLATTDLTRDYCIEVWDGKTWTEWTEERLGFHAGWLYSMRERTDSRP